MSQSQIEADEAYARELQAREGFMFGSNGVNIQLAPRRGDNNQNVENNEENINNDNPTVLNARLNQLSTARATVAAIVIVHIPQIIAAIIILAQYWNDNSHCDEIHRERWKWWAALSSFRMAVYTASVCYLYFFRDWLQDHPTSQQNATNIRNISDALGLVWFVVGNMWIFGDSSCNHRLDSPVYNLCLAMVIISYVQICLPCIIAILLIPVFCFCMPCLIRILARIHDTPKGATDAIIEAIPTVTLAEDSELLTREGDNTCPICLSEMVVGEKVRILQCNHFFHNACVDEWLKVNASCPTCRENILNSRDEESGNNAPEPSRRERANQDTPRNESHSNSNHSDEDDDAESLPLFRQGDDMA